MLKKILALAALLLSATLALAAVDVNKATEAELDGIKGVGPATTKLILTERKKGEFKDWDDFIHRVKGVGDARAQKLSEGGLTVNGAAYKAADAKAVAPSSDKKDAKAKDPSPAKESAKPGTAASSPTKAAASGAKK